MQLLANLQQKVNLFSEEDCVPVKLTNSDIPMMKSMMRRKRRGSMPHAVIPHYLNYLLLDCDADEDLEQELNDQGQT